MKYTKSLRSKVSELKITESDVLDIVKYKFGFDKQQLISKCRKKEYVDARRLIFYILKNKFGLTLKKIGTEYGGRDHTTISHSINRFYDLYETDLNYQENCDYVLNILDIK